MRAVLLDALGTLVRLEPPAPLLVAALAARGVTVSEAQAGAALREEIAFYRAEHHRARDRPALEALRDDCAAVLGAALPEHARAAPDLRGALLEAIRFTPFGEVPEVLRELRARGCALVVCSNWDVSLRDVLATTGLAPLLDGVVTSAEHGAAKPDPSPFLAALALAGGVAPADAVHVGDEPATDVVGARRAGVRPVLVDREGSGTAPDGAEVVADLTGLLRLSP